MINSFRGVIIGVTSLALFSCDAEKNDAENVSSEATQVTEENFLTPEEKAQLDALTSNGFRYSAATFDFKKFTKDLRLLDKLSLAKRVAVDPKKALERYLSSVVSRFPMEIWESFTEDSGQLLQDYPAFGEKLVSEIVKVDAGKAIILIAQRSGSPIEWLNQGVRAFALENEGKFYEWFKANRKSLSDDMSNQIALAAINFYREAGRYRDAFHWIDLTQNPAVHKGLRNSMWKEEKAKALQMARKNPEKFANSIISGESSFADYWLSQIFEVWIKSYPDQALAWYREKYERLPQNQREFITMSYVRDAIEKKDFDSARKLIEAIKTQNLLTKINAELAEAQK